MERDYEATFMNCRRFLLPVAVVTPPDESVSSLGGTMVAYDRRIAGEARQFTRTADGDLRAGCSLWDSASGRALDGRHAGTRLDALRSTVTYWFSWREFHPETTVYGRESRS
jgi:hypothetical protein